MSRHPTTRIVQDELGPNERILWAGQPKLGLVLRSNDAVQIPFSLFLCGIVVFMIGVTIISWLPLFGSVLVIPLVLVLSMPFVLIVVYITLGRFFSDALWRSKTYYALTNKRVIIISGFMNRNVKSLSLYILSDIRLYQKKDGTGTITFGPRHSMSRMLEGDFTRRKYITPGFYMINEVEEVYNRIRKAQAASAKADNLQFKSYLLDFLKSGKTGGHYRGYYLQLEYKSYPNITCLTLSVEDEELMLDYDIEIQRPITEAVMLKLIAPAGLPEKLKGNIRSFYDGFEIHYEQSGQETVIDYLQTLLDLVCDIADAYPKIVALGGETISALQSLAYHRPWLRAVITELIGTIGQETKERLSSQAAQLLCPKCFVYCAPHQVPLQLRQSVTYYGCRNCGQSNEFLDFKGPVVAVLDNRTDVTQLAQNNKLYINWSAHREQFDFDEVEIIRATDEDVERFAVQAGNETDPVRQSSYKQVECVVSPESRLSANTMRILQKTFGQVEVKMLQEISN